jgi:hypothetical protein
MIKLHTHTGTYTYIHTHPHTHTHTTHTHTHTQIDTHRLDIIIIFTKTTGAAFCVYITNAVFAVKNKK